MKRAVLLVVIGVLSLPYHLPAQSDQNFPQLCETGNVDHC